MGFRSLRVVVYELECEFSLLRIAEQSGCFEVERRPALDEQITGTRRQLSSDGGEELVGHPRSRRLEGIELKNRRKRNRTLGSSAFQWPQRPTATATNGGERCAAFAVRISTFVPCLARVDRHPSAGFGTSSPSKST